VDVTVERMLQHLAKAAFFVHFTF